MTLKHLFLLVIGTIGIGMIFGYLISLTGILGPVLPLSGLITGGFVSATSLMGFWAYLMLNFIMRGFVSFRVWSVTQTILLLIVYIDVVVLRHDLRGPADSFLPYILFATVPLLAAVCIAFIKVKISGKRSFIPAMFFLYVFTVLEWIPGLKISSQLNMQILIGTLLFCCNAFLVLMLNKMLKPVSIQNREQQPVGIK